MFIQFLLIGLVPFFACLGAKPVVRPGIQRVEYSSVKPLVVETMKFECYENVIPSVMINVRWFINDIEILEAKHSNISPKNIENALLLKYHWDYRFKPNMNVKCLIEFMDPGNPVPLQSHNSEDFVAGIVMNNGDLDVTATTAETLRIPVKLTIPFVCNINPSLSPRLKERLLEMCDIRLEPTFPAYQNDNNCTGNLFFAPQPCNLRFTYNNWNKTQYATVNNVDRGSYAIRRLNFFGLNALAAFFVADDEGTWKGFHTPTVKIIWYKHKTNKMKKRCEVNNGTNISSFDGRVYELTNTVGEYTIYSHKEIPVQVNAIFGKCQQNKLCICGVAVRSMASVFVANFCLAAGQPKQKMKKTICSIDDINVQKSGNHVLITTQTSKITLNTMSFDNVGILIESSYSDFGMTSGLCGQLNDDVTDDLIPKGFLTPVNDVTNFTSSWRELTTDSLFTTKSIKPMEIVMAPFCGCRRNLLDAGREFNKLEIECLPLRPTYSCLFNDLPWMQRHCESILI